MASPFKPLFGAGAPKYTPPSGAAKLLSAAPAKRADPFAGISAGKPKTQEQQQVSLTGKTDPEHYSLPVPGLQAPVRMYKTLPPFLDPSSAGSDTPVPGGLEGQAQAARLRAGLASGKITPEKAVTEWNKTTLKQASILSGGGFLNWAASIPEQAADIAIHIPGGVVAAVKDPVGTAKQTGIQTYEMGRHPIRSIVQQPAATFATIAGGVSGAGSAVARGGAIRSVMRGAVADDLVGAVASLPKLQARAYGALIHASDGEKLSKLLDTDTINVLKNPPKQLQTVLDHSPDLMNQRNEILQAAGQMPVKAPSLIGGTARRIGNTQGAQLAKAAIKSPTPKARRLVIGTTEDGEQVVVNRLGSKNHAVNAFQRRVIDTAKQKSIDKTATVPNWGKANPKVFLGASKHLSGSATAGREIAAAQKVMDSLELSHSSALRRFGSSAPARAARIATSVVPGMTLDKGSLLKVTRGVRLSDAEHKAVEIVLSGKSPQEFIAAHTNSMENAAAEGNRAAVRESKRQALLAKAGAQHLDNIGFHYGDDANTIASPEKNKALSQAITEARHVSQVQEKMKIDDLGLDPDTAVARIGKKAAEIEDLASGGKITRLEELSKLEAEQAELERLRKGKNSTKTKAIESLLNRIQKSIKSEPNHTLIQGRPPTAEEVGQYVKPVRDPKIGPLIQSLPKHIQQKANDYVNAHIRAGEAGDAAKAVGTGPDELKMAVAERELKAAQKAHAKEVKLAEKNTARLTGESGVGDNIYHEAYLPGNKYPTGSRLDQSIAGHIVDAWNNGYRTFSSESGLTSDHPPRGPHESQKYMRPFIIFEKDTPGLDRINESRKGTGFSMRQDSNGRHVLEWKGKEPADPVARDAARKAATDRFFENLNKRPAGKRPATDRATGATVHEVAAADIKKLRKDIEGSHLTDKGKDLARSVTGGPNSKVLVSRGADGKINAILRYEIDRGENSMIVHEVAGVGGHGLALVKEAARKAEADGVTHVEGMTTKQGARAASRMGAEMSDGEDNFGRPVAKVEIGRLTGGEPSAPPVLPTAERLAAATAARDALSNAREGHLNTRAQHLATAADLRKELTDAGADADLIDKVIGVTKPGPPPRGLIHGLQDAVAQLSKLQDDLGTHAAEDALQPPPKRRFIGSPAKEAESTVVRSNVGAAKEYIDSLEPEQQTAARRFAVSLKKNAVGNRAQAVAAAAAERADRMLARAEAAASRSPMKHTNVQTPGKDLSNAARMRIVDEFGDSPMPKDAKALASEALRAEGRTVTVARDARGKVVGIMDYDAHDGTLEIGSVGATGGAGAQMVLRAMKLAKADSAIVGSLTNQAQRAVKKFGYDVKQEGGHFVIQKADHVADSADHSMRLWQHEMEAQQVGVDTDHLSSLLGGNRSTEYMNVPEKASLDVEDVPGPRVKLQDTIDALKAEVAGLQKNLGKNDAKHAQLVALDKELQRLSGLKASIRHSELEVGEAARLDRIKQIHGDFHSLGKSLMEERHAAYIPDVSTHGFYRAPRPGTLIQPTGLTTKIKAIPQLTHEYTGAMFRTGNYRNDVTGVLADQYRMAQRAASIKKAVDALYSISKETMAEAGPNATPIRTTAHIPQKLKQFLREADEGTLNRRDSQVLDDELVSWLKEALPRTADPNDTGVRWIDGNLAKGLHQDLSYRMPEGAAKFLDTINSPLRAALLYTKPSYALNGLQAIGTNMVQQGVFTPVNMYHALNLGSGLGWKAQHEIFSLMGEGLSRSLESQGGPMYGAIHGAGEFWNKVVDRYPRVSSWLHEARREGFNTPEKIDFLLHHPEAREKLVEITRRANREAIDYGNLSPFERNVVKRALFFYPWIRGSTLYALRFPVEHPIQAAIGAHLGQIGQQQQEDRFGPHLASSAKGLVGFGGGKSADFSGINNFATPAEMFNAGAGLLKHRTNEASALLGNLTPAIGAAVTALTGKTSSGSDLPAGTSRAEGAFEQLVGSLPPVVFARRSSQVEDSTNPAKQHVEPGGFDAAWKKYVGGRAFPLQRNEAALASKGETQYRSSLDAKQKVEYLANLQISKAVTEAALLHAHGVIPSPDVPAYFGEAVALKSGLQIAYLDHAKSIKTKAANLTAADKFPVMVDYLAKHKKITPAFGVTLKNAVRGDTDPQLKSDLTTIWNKYGGGQDIADWNAQVKHYSAQAMPVAHSKTGAIG